LTLKAQLTLCYNFFGLLRIRMETAPLIDLEDSEHDKMENASREVIKENPSQQQSTYGALSQDTGKDDDDGKPDSLASKALATKPHIPRQNACLWLFHFLEGVTVIAALCLLATQVIPLCYLPASEIPAKIGILSLALKIYISAFCVLFCLVEAGWPIPWIRSSPLLQVYISRGFLYSFLGLICVEESTSERIKDIVHKTADELHVSWAAIFMQISSWCFLATGMLYMLLGLCCMKRVRDRLQQKEKDDWQEYRKAIKEWNDLHT
jgi:hypothetical protein